MEKFDLNEKTETTASDSSMPPEFPNLVIIDGKVHRRYTETWRKSGDIDIERIPDWVAAIVSQQKYMVQYIEELHNKIDELISTTSTKD